MKSQHTSSFLSFIIYCMMLSASSPAIASHAAGGEITYTHVAGNSYVIRMTLYRDCFGIPAPASVVATIASAQCALSFQQTLFPIPGTGQEVTFPCTGTLTTCQGGTEPGLQKWVYEGTYAFPAQCADWVIGVSQSARNAAITTIQNPGSNDLYIEARLNNLTTDNSSPQFTNNPLFFLCLGQVFHFNNGMVDPDGDSLTYTIVPALNAPNTPVVYMPGYSANNPVTSAPPAMIDPYTGDFFVHPLMQEVGVIVVQVNDYRNGELMGSVMRDIQIYTVPCANIIPSVTGINGTTQQSAPAVPTKSICFNIFSDDADAGDTVTMEWNGGIQGAVFTSSGTPHPTGVFCWTPSLADVRPQPYLFTVTVRDNNCPTNGTDMYSFFVYVSLDSTFIDITGEHQWNTYSWNTYSGSVYWDSNSNGIKDTNEINFSGQRIDQLPENFSVFSNFSGEYITGSWYDSTHSITVIPPAGWMITSDSTSYTFNDSLDHGGLDFGINGILSFNYIDVNLSAGNPRCNNDVSYWITYENTGTTAANGRVLFVLDTAVTFNSSMPPPDLITGDTLYFNFTNLLPFTSEQIWVTLDLPGPGDTLHFAVYVQYDSLGVYYTCGEQALQQIVLCSYDPNDKAVSPEGLFTDHRTLYTDSLRYTIRFQNTGNDTAFTVFIQDFIDPALDLSTFHITGSSHVMSTTIYPNRMVEFRFENILLPDSNVNEPESHGFVQYEILPRTNLSLPVVVNNNASIFFDSNLPVLTNTVTNNLVADLFVAIPYAEVTKETAIVVPNPFSENAQLMLGDKFGDEEYEISILNILGTVVQTYRASGQKLVISRNSLPPGIYFYEVVNRNDLRVSGKFIIQ